MPETTPDFAPPFRLYGLTPFDRSGKVRWLLNELGLPYEDRWLDRDKGDAEHPDFLRLNPLGRVPVFEAGKRSLFESGAICAYLGDRYLDRGFAPALAAPERAVYQQWMYFASSTVEEIPTRMMIIEDIPAGEVQISKQAALVADLRDALVALDGTLAQGDYLVAGRFSVADICVGYHLYFARLWPELEVVMHDFARIQAYLARLQARPAAIKSKVFSYPG